MRTQPRVLVVDNFDSFVYILVQYLGELGAEPLVVRNNVPIDEIVGRFDPDGVLISPGPGDPDRAGSSLDVIAHYTDQRPILGVCLGHQAIGQHFGATVIRAPELMHGKTSFIRHEGEGVFRHLPNPLEATRYHSLILERDTLGDDLVVTAETDDGLVMGIRHRAHDVEGVQFHPESVLTMGGRDIVTSFLERC